MQPSQKVLDGGWGWAIVAASFMAQLLAYGSPQSVGVLYPEWLQAFRQGKGMTAWVGSLVAGVGLVASEYRTQQPFKKKMQLLPEARVRLVKLGASPAK